MANPIINKTTVDAVVQRQQQQDATPQIEKTSASKFDEVRASKQQDSVNLPPELNQVSMEQKRVLESEMRKMLQSQGPEQIQKSMQAEFNRVTSNVQNLNQRVSALPKTPEFDPLRHRLQSIENRFNQSSKLLQGVDGTDPRAMLQVQMQMFQLTQNVELMSKVVEQVNTGTKQILQTQI
jgi:hypothetical protein